MSFPLLFPVETASGAREDAHVPSGISNHVNSVPRLFVFHYLPAVAAIFLTMAITSLRSLSFRLGE